MRKRLFVAIGANHGIEKEVEQITKKLRISADSKELEITWHRPGQLHITVAFLGATDESSIDEIKNRLTEACTNQQNFSLKISGMGAFPEILHARVVYLEVQNSQNLLDLVTTVEQALNRQETQTYTPHMTIARLRNPKSVKDFISPFVRKKIGKIQVSELVLYESIQAGSTSAYKEIQRFAFGNPTI